jgi:hypothetical protein
VALSEADAELIRSFLAATSHLSPERAGEVAGLQGMTIRRWQDELPSRLTTDNRKRLLAFMEAIDVASRGVVRERKPAYDDSAEMELLDMLGMPEALRRMAGHVPAADLAAAAMQLAVDDGWSAERRDRLAQLCFEMLERAKDRG